MAGKLGTIPLAAQSVIMTTDQVLNTIPFGVGVATSARVGNLLGARDATGARRSSNVAAWLSMILGALVLAVLMGVKDFYAKIFNDDQAVVELTAKVMPYVALFQIADGLNGSCGGALRGQGRQHIGAAVNIVSYYCGALPLGIWLAFNGWGLEGLWVGQCIALVSCEAPKDSILEEHSLLTLFSTLLVSLSGQLWRSAIGTIKSRRHSSGWKATNGEPA